MPNSLEASSRARQAILNRQRFSTNTTRSDIFQCSIKLQAQGIPKHALLRQKPCSSNSNVVSQFVAPLSSASSTALEYGALTSDCNTKSFFLSASRSFSFSISVDARFCLLAIPSKSVSLDESFSTRDLQSLSGSLNF